MIPTRSLLSLPFSPQIATKRFITPLTRRLFQLPTPSANPSPSHTDLPSFLSYAQRTALPESTTIYQGTIYEYTVQNHLRTAAFNLHRVGGRSDLGIDLQGTWHVGPNQVLDPPVRVIVQCKALRTKIGPNIVRELEGVTARHFAPSGGIGAGVLVSPREATKGVRDALGRSGMPLVWMMMGREGSVRQVLWNGRMEGLGLGGLGVEVLYPADMGEDSDGHGHGKGKARLTWDGTEVQTMDEVEEGMSLLEDEWMAKWEERGLGSISGEELLDAVERILPGTRPIMISEQERDAVVRDLLST
ncbi:uncharacterized protein APUU_51269A [Aspergillus puulaauensis]|uniref:Restriction endonuclease type IV Mrr domain-containing protein n=1 Tax=Aspergillus puulaauensis TaxID=1220207 RepID=A0A7R8AR56_9EURO|nr:uncharacterized protein APUU_51269A [Aspergillus puulaauensis]BCS26558.1 hypothetical protein APUU_51269A [Aspergillus puulaauensis]